MKSANLHLYDWVVGQTVFIGVTQRRPSLRSIAWGRYFRRAGEAVCAVACAARQNFPGAFLFAGPGAVPFRQKWSLEDPTRGILLFNARLFDPEGCPTGFDRRVAFWQVPQSPAGVKPAKGSGRVPGE